MVMILGIVILGLGVCLFKLSCMGNDPHSAMVMAIGNRFGISFSVLLIGVNTFWFLFELAFGRSKIGIGTFFNWIFVGVFVDMWTGLITGWVTIPDTFAAKMLIMLIGIFVLSFACAMYQTADLGIAPYDAISLIMDERLPMPYFWCRIITDSVCTLLAVVFGGIVGLGTLFCAFGLGPFISFFSKRVVKRMLHDRISDGNGTKG